MRTLFLFCLVAGFFIHLKASSLPGNDSLICLNRHSKWVFAGRYPLNNDFKSLRKTLKKNKINIKGGLIFVYDSKTGLWNVHFPGGHRVEDSIQSFNAGASRQIIARKAYAWGIMDFGGKWPLKPFYKELRQLAGNEYEALSFDHWELRNRQKLLVQQFHFDDILLLDSNIVAYRVSNRWGLLEVKNRHFITQAIYNGVSLVNDSLLFVSADGQNGVIDKKGDIRVPLLFDTLGTDGSDYIRTGIKVKADSGKSHYLWGLYRADGKKLVPTKFNFIGNSSEGLFPVEKNGEWGYYNTRGLAAIPEFYETAGPFRKGLAVVQKNGKKGILSLNGIWNMFPEYEDILFVNDSTWIFLQNGRYKFFTPQTAKYSGLTYEYLSPAPFGYFYFKKNKKHGLLNDACRLVLKPAFDTLWVDEDVRRVVGLRQRQFTLFDLSGHELSQLSIKTDKVYPFNNGMAIVVREARYGFIDRDGQLVVSTQYDGAQPFFEDFAAVKINAKWGFIDKTEKFIVSPYYDTVFAFYQHIAVVVKNKKFGFIDATGREVTPVQFDFCRPSAFGNYLVKSNGKTGMVNKRGIEVVNPVYDELEDLGYGLLRVRQFGRYGIMDYKNRPYVPLEFDNVRIEPKTGLFVAMRKGETKKITVK